MIDQALHDAMIAACAAVRINPPRREPAPGRWVQVDTYERNGKGDGRILIFDDERGGICWNHQTQQSRQFSARRHGEPVQSHGLRRDPEKERRRQDEQREVERICADIVRTCRHEPHPYLARKGFPDERGLVHDDPRACFPATSFGEVLAKALPEADGPLLIVPGRIDRRITTVQFIATDGTKKNILRGAMGGASHRIATGRLSVVCEGIATAMSVRAALRFLSLSATVLSAFSASNVAKVAAGIPEAWIAADNDKPIEALGNLGTGEFYAAESGRKWTMPPELGDFNDMHMAHGLRALALHLQEVLRDTS
ncbi:toprim domain-containing protein [Xanthobacter autotrophicus]|uniref:toprim domain-containing protein n=1 Tax=Xanthobacter autotrophicus TaxID=280 RepID=UPI00372C155F